MKIAKVQLKNVLGIGQLEFDAGRFNEIAGANGSGKTSVLEAIKAAVGGGNDATLLKAGEEKGEIVLVLDDDTTIRRRLGKTQSVTVDKAGVRQDKPQETLNALHDMFSVNPVAFLDAKPKERLDIFLEALPAQADPERIRQIVRQADFPIEGATAIEQIDAAYKTLFAERRETNVAIREKEGSINQLAQTLPQETLEGVNPDDTEETLATRLANIDAAWEAEKARISTKLDGLRETKDAKVAEMRQQIARLQESITAEVEAFAKMEAAAGAQRTNVSEPRWRAEREPVQRSLDLVRANRSAATTAETTRTNMKTLREAADRLTDDAERMTKSLKALEAYKAELLASIPIDGLEVVEGQLVRHGVPFDRLNEAQQVEIAFEVAALRAGDLRVVCVDGIEQLGNAAMAALKAKAEASDLQCFVTRVDPDDASPLTVTAA